MGTNKLPLERFVIGGGSEFDGQQLWAFFKVKRAEDFKLLDKLAQEEWTGENAIRISYTNRERIFCMVSKRKKADTAQIYDTARVAHSK